MSRPPVPVRLIPLCPGKGAPEWRGMEAIQVGGLPEIEEGAALGELIAARAELAGRRRRRDLPEGRLQGRGTASADSPR